jgi:hypothetical protein
VHLSTALFINFTTPRFQKLKFQRSSMKTVRTIDPLWVSPEHIQKAPLTLHDLKFARDLLDCYNSQRKMSKKRTYADCADPEPPEAELRPTTTMTFFEHVAGALSSVASSVACSFINLFTTTQTAPPAPEAIYTYTKHLGSKRRLVETIDPSTVPPPTPLAQRYRVPGAFPTTSDPPHILTLENAQAAWDAADIEQRKRMVYGDPSVPYWRKNDLPPHFPYADMEQMLEHKYLQAADPGHWDRSNFHNYKPKVRYPPRVYKPEYSKVLPTVLHPIYLQPPTKEEINNAYPWEPKTMAYERVLDVSSYRPFTGIRKFAASASSFRPTTVEQITDRIKHYKSVRERRDFDRAYPGILRWRQQYHLGIHHPKPKAYPGIQKTSPHKYRHGQNRPSTSVLKTSDPNYRPFEPHLEDGKSKDEDELKSKSILAATNTPDGEDALDISMMDVDGPPARGVHWPAESQITGKLHQPTKLFYDHEPINKLPSELRQYREHTPVEDDSLLADDTPKRYFGKEQDNEPNYSIDDPDLEEMAKNWAAKTRLEAENFKKELMRWSDPHADPDQTPSKAFQERSVRNHERLMASRLEKHEEMLAKIAARHEQERRVREAAAAKKAEEERQLQEALAQKEKERQKARVEEAKAYHNAISLIKPLSEEWAAKINAAMATPDKTAIIIQKHYISRHDLGTILPQKGVDSPSAWLNDQIVNGSLKQMVDHALALEGHDKTKPAKYWAANSNWYDTVMRSTRGDGITKWLGKRGVNLKGKNLLEAELIFLPVCRGNHWTLVVVKPKERIIEYMDSLSNKREDHSKIKVALDWISYELGKDFDMSEWRSVFNRSPQQNNGEDCGAFVIMNAMATIRKYDPMEWVSPRNMNEARRNIVAHLMNGGYTGEFAWMEKSLEMPDSYREMLAAQAKG